MGLSKRRYRQYVKDFKNRSAKIPWNYYVKILTNEYGAVQQKTSQSAGSRRTFVIEEKNIVFSLDEPHGKELFVDKWGHHKVLELFARNGLVGGDE